jgi:hypothetical protein
MPDIIEDDLGPRVVVTLAFTVMTLITACAAAAAFALRQEGIIAGVIALLGYPIVGIVYARSLSPLSLWAFGSPWSKMTRALLGAVWTEVGLPVTLYLVLHGLIKRLM